MAALAALTLTLAAPPPPRPAATQVVTLPRRAIRLADLAPSTTGDAGQRVVARIPADRDRVTLSRAAIGSLVARAVPGQPARGLRRTSVTFVVRQTVARTTGSPACSATIAPVAAGAAIGRTMVVPVPCDGSRAAMTAFDRAAAVLRAASDLPAGAYLGRLHVDAADGIHAGEATSLVSTAGPVRIVRRVTAMQASRGRRVFVRDADGQVFSVRRAELAK